MDKLEVISVNVRWLNNEEKRIKVYDWLCDTKVHIIFLQETHFVEKNEYKYNARWFGKSFHCFFLIQALVEVFPFYFGKIYLLKFLMFIKQ